MKLTIGDFEVDIKAKHTYENRCNKLSTMAFLNMISIYASQAAMYEEDRNILGDERRKAANDIYDALDKLGFYD